MSINNNNGLKKHVERERTAETKIVSIHREVRIFFFTYVQIHILLIHRYGAFVSLSVNESAPAQCSDTSIFVFFSY